MEIYIKEIIIKYLKYMDMEKCLMRMVLFMTVNGQRIKDKDKENLYGQMVINMKVLGKKIKKMDLEHI